ncbi:phage virion morphogenesis protein [Pseudomonas sp. AU12215]|uniref:phage virion morphogenesis protein n=1 Tax=Pseudomonas sp. AU12215 TaxID=1860123 RepID=UPI0007EE7743|nr:phage virion morphogenesis protein [Pseudomonas sp. AU12215]OBY58232.1 phage virion morphogenesis protein [Pseudomonas sp. AU12215]
MAGVTLEYDVSRVMEALQSAADLLRNPVPMFRDMGEYMLLALDARFESQTAPDGTPWQALSPSYQKRKRKNQDKILVLDGYLKNTIRYQVSENELAVGTNRLYAAIHQFGGEIQIAARSQQAYFHHDAKSNEIAPRFANKRKANFSQWVTLGPYTIKIPARPWLGTSTEDDDELLAIAYKHLDKAFSGTGS